MNTDPSKLSFLSGVFGKKGLEYMTILKNALRQLGLYPVNNVAEDTGLLYGSLSLSAYIKVRNEPL